MLDIHFIRENPDLVKQAAKKKNVEIDVDRLLAVDEERKGLLHQIEEKRAEQNRASKTIMLAKGEEKAKLLEAMRFLKSGMGEIQEKFDALDLEWTKLMLAMPNIPSPDTPEGKMRMKTSCYANGARFRSLRLHQSHTGSLVLS